MNAANLLKGKPIENPKNYIASQIKAKRTIWMRKNAAGSGHPLKIKKIKKSWMIGVLKWDWKVVNCHYVMLNSQN
jgi:hypothetical protein